MIRYQLYPTLLEACRIFRDTVVPLTVMMVCFGVLMLALMLVGSNDPVVGASITLLAQDIFSPDLKPWGTLCLTFLWILARNNTVREATLVDQVKRNLGSLYRGLVIWSFFFCALLFLEQCVWYVQHEVLPFEVAPSRYGVWTQLLPAPSSVILYGLFAPLFTIALVEKKTIKSFARNLMLIQGQKKEVFFTILVSATVLSTLSTGFDVFWAQVDSGMLAPYPESRLKPLTSVRGCKATGG